MDILLAQRLARSRSVELQAEADRYRLARAARAVRRAERATASARERDARGVGAEALAPA